MTRHTLAERLAQAIEEQSLQVAHIANETGIPEPYIVRLLTGRLRQPPLFAVQRLAVSVGRSDRFLQDGIAPAGSPVATASKEDYAWASATGFNKFVEEHQIGWDEQTRLWDLATANSRCGPTSREFTAQNWAAAYQVFFGRPCPARGYCWSCENCGHTEQRPPLMCPVCAKDGLRTAEG